MNMQAETNEELDDIQKERVAYLLNTDDAFIELLNPTQVVALKFPSSETVNSGHGSPERSWFSRLAVEKDCWSSSLPKS